MQRRCGVMGWNEADGASCSAPMTQDDSMVEGSLESVVKYDS